MDRLKGKHVIITGAAGGQGRCACEVFAREGARVLASDLDAAVGGEIEALGPGAITYVAAHLGAPGGIEAITKAAVRHLGHVDVLYNNHGVILGKPFMETTPEEWDLIHNVDLKSVYFLTQSIVALMPAGGSIINISSIGGLLACENMTAYGAAKGGLVMLTRGLALDLAGRSIRANAICPGVIDTPMPRNFIKNLPDKETILEALAQRHIVKRLGQPHEIIGLAVFLASDESSFMNGSIIAADGGWTAF